MSEKQGWQIPERQISGLLVSLSSKIYNLDFTFEACWFIFPKSFPGRIVEKSLVFENPEYDSP